MSDDVYRSPTAPLNSWAMEEKSSCRARSELMILMFPGGAITNVTRHPSPEGGPNQHDAAGRCHPRMGPPPRSR